MAEETFNYLFVFSDPQGSEITDEDYHKWYDDDHLPKRKNCPGFYSAIRYEAVDASYPRFAAYYEFKPGTLQTDAYKRLFIERTEEEARIFPKIQLSRREYKLLDTHGKSGINKPAPVIVYAGVSPQKGAEEAFKKWYLEEHIPLVKKNPGWIGCRRFVKADPSLDGTTFLVVHEYENTDFQTSPEMRACMEQAIDWMGKNLDKDIVRERRVMRRLYD